MFNNSCTVLLFNYEH